MARIVAIDYGAKRCGIAVTDPLKIIAQALTTVDTSAIFNFLKTYCKQNEVEHIVVGIAQKQDGSDTHSTPLIRRFVQQLRSDHPTLPISTIDERHTSKEAQASMVQSGMKKKDRRNKKIIDQIAAVIILQHYLETL